MDDLSLSAAELKDIRGRLEWSQQRMADELAVARNTVVRMENGQMAIERRTALAVRYLAWHHAMIEKVSRQQPGQPATASPAPELGDAHQQVQIQFHNSDNSYHLSSDAGPLHHKAIAAWFIYSHRIMAHPAGSELRDRYFQIAADADELGYNYYFFSQLLELLVDMPKSSSDWPLQWCNIRELRLFAKNLYKSNPQFQPH